MNTPQAEQLGRGIMTLCPRQMGTLPLIAPFLSALQVRRIVNGLVPSQADIDPGRIVELLVLNRLLAPKPLYQVSDWFAETVLPEVLVSVRSKSTIIVWDVTWTGFILTRYQDIWRPFTFEHQGEQVTDRVLVVWSAGKQRWMPRNAKPI